MLYTIFCIFFIVFQNVSNVKITVLPVLQKGRLKEKLRYTPCNLVLGVGKRPVEPRAVQ